VLGTTVGGGTQGNVQTFGPSGTTLSTVNAAGTTTANGPDTTATGVGAQAGAPGSPSPGATAYGAYAAALATGATAIGYRSIASFAGGVAIGNNAQATADPATAIGDSSLASGNDSTAIGASAKATANRAVALGSFSVADQPNTVSVGSPGNERRITNVAPGINPTDAVNLSQLQDVSRIAYSGTAMGFAMSGAVMPTLEAGEKGVGIGLGNYKGYSAVALQFKAISEMGYRAWGVGVSTTGKEWGIQLGYGVKWK
jgi:trimeric autotransporter adhesin